MAQSLQVIGSNYFERFLRETIMNKIIKRISIILLCSSILLPASAFARGGSDMYVGVGVGQSTQVNQGSPNENSLGYKLFAGLHATGPFYAEVSIVNLGEFNNNSYEVSGNGIHVIGKLPFSATVAALAKVGLFSWDVQSSGGGSTTGSDTAYGFAIAWNMMGYIARVEWETYSDIGQTNPSNGSDFSLLSVGLEMHF